MYHKKYPVYSKFVFTFSWLTPAVVSKLRWVLENWINMHIEHCSNLSCLILIYSSFWLYSFIATVSRLFPFNLLLPYLSSIFIYLFICIFLHLRLLFCYDFSLFSLYSLCPYFSLLRNKNLLFTISCSRLTTNPNCVRIFPGNHCGSRYPGHIFFGNWFFCLFILFMMYLMTLSREQCITSNSRMIVEQYMEK
jgi:hypothetical protein